MQLYLASGQSHVSVVLWKAQLFLSAHDPASLTASQLDITFDLGHVLLADQGSEHVVRVVGITHFYLPGRGREGGREGGREREMEGGREGERGREQQLLHLLLLHLKTTMYGLALY